MAKKKNGTQNTLWSRLFAVAVLGIVFNVNTKKEWEI
jgi:hypothetical protein